ncbi:hypothetical protein BpHYR1_029439 [Brachionus plicatilis]|uniref:Uncharacterized protein n=1 Tax=Brachionus plicatilis TaxID=10195 RepID=A0A3M7QNE2_BRAPC|nr:hypothetical protein BpHYR1_029439 [Brachionus plicatilis]
MKPDLANLKKSYLDLIFLGLLNNSGSSLNLKLKTDYCYTQYPVLAFRLFSFPFFSNNLRYSSKIFL